MSQSIQVVFACEDPHEMAVFWSQVLGYVLQPPPPGFDSWDAFADEVGIPEDRRNDISAAVDPDGEGPRLLFERWDGGTPNKRVHIDLNTIGEVEDRPGALAAERQRLEGLGAVFLRDASGMAGETWIEMYDPEGNWFCVQ